MMRLSRVEYRRPLEGLLLALALLLAVTVFLSAAVALRSEDTPEAEAVTAAVVPALAAGLALIGVHIALNARGQRSEQLIVPLIGTVFFIGLVLIWRLRGSDGAFQQLLRGFMPGMALVAGLVLWPQAVERVRRWAIPISMAGLVLALLTGILGSADETGARLALKLGPLPAIQTSEMIKLALIIFLAWFIDREGRRVEGRSLLVAGLRVPPLRYFMPGLLFVGVATLALVRMSDFGAVLILGFIFVAMLFAGFNTRLFATIALIALAMVVVVTLVLVFAWDVPAVIENRFIAWRNPWSTEPWLINGQPTGFTIAEGPGYQIQQAVYAAVSGGLSGTGLGLGSPEYIPLAASDFIFASLMEEMGAMVAFAVLAFYAVILVRMLRIAMLLPGVQVFERLLAVGIAIHLFTQVFVMVGGTLNLIPLTGVTIPFLSQGGSALLTNLFEVGLVLALAQRVERPLR